MQLETKTFRLTVYVAVFLIIVLNFNVNVPITKAASITMGETNILTNPDNNNANLILAQQATLSQQAILQSLSFYATSAAGSLRLGVYDATGANGQPGAKLAETNSFSTVTGWNTANVINQVTLNPGNYYLAYLPNNNSLAFVKNDVGPTSYLYSYSFGTMPNSFSTTPSATPSHWSLFASLITTGASDTTPPSVTITSPAAGAIISNTATISANASDDVAVGGVTFKVDGTTIGSEDTTSPYSASWDSTTVSNGSHTLTAVARDTSNNTTISVSVSITTSNTTQTTGCSATNIRCVGSGQEYTSIQTAVNAAVAGDTVIVMSGTYSGFTVSNSGASGNVIDIRGYSGSSCPTVTNPDTSSRGLRPSPAVTLTSGVSVTGSYVTVECFKVSNASFGFDVSGQGSNHISFLDNVVDDSGAPGGDGFAFEYANATTSAQQPSYITASRNYVTQTGICFFVVVNNLTVTDNECNHMNNSETDYAQLWGDTHLWQNNYFHGNVYTDAQNAHSDCYQTFNLGMSNETLRYARNITITRNTCFNADEGLITSNSTSNSTMMQNWTVTNNIFAFPRLNGGGAGGGGFGSTVNALFAYNTVYQMSFGCGRSDSTVNATVTVKSNILDGTFAVNPNCTATVTNNIQQSSANLVNAAGANFHLQSTSTAAINLGTTGLGVTVDHDNKTRDSQPDIGAYEFTSGGATPIVGDINLDHIVNSIDYSILNAHWFTSDAASDLNHDGLVNAIDYSLMNANWFKTW